MTEDLRSAEGVEQAILAALESHGKPPMWTYIVVGVITAAFAVGGSWAVINRRIEEVPDRYTVQSMVRESMKESPWSQDKARVEQQIIDCEKRVAIVERLLERVQVQHEQIVDMLTDLQADIHGTATKRKHS